MNKQQFLKLLSVKLTSGLSDRENRQLEQAIRANKEFEEIALGLTDYFKHKEVIKGINTEDRLEEVWRLIEGMQSGKERAFKFTGDKTKGKAVSGVSFFLKIAAILLILLSSGVIFYKFYSREKTTAFTSLNVSDNVFKTLDDGTKVWLNKGSHLRYNKDFGINGREIVLEGKAFFDVAKNASVPLFIHAGGIDIEVKGTAFNVDAWKNRKNIEVTLIRGSIEVSSNANKAHKILLKPNEKLLVLPGKNNRFVFKVSPLDSIKRAKEIKWTKEALTFKKEKLKNLAVQLEYRYHVKIEIRNDKLKEKQFSGVLKEELLNEALDALKLSYPFNYTISNQLVIIK